MQWHKAGECSRQEMRCASSLTLTLCSLPHCSIHDRLPLALQHRCLLQRFISANPPKLEEAARCLNRRFHAVASAVFVVFDPLACPVLACWHCTRYPSFSRHVRSQGQTDKLGPARLSMFWEPAHAAAANQACHFKAPLVFSSFDMDRPDSESSDPPPDRPALLFIIIHRPPQASIRLPSKVAVVPRCTGFADDEVGEMCGKRQIRYHCCQSVPFRGTTLLLFCRERWLGSGTGCRNRASTMPVMPCLLLP